MKAWIPGLFAFLLAGCGLTPTGDFLKQTIAVRGAEIEDEGLENAEWWICEKASHGSVKRRYWISAKLAEAHRVICERDGAGLVGPG